MEMTIKAVEVYDKKTEKVVESNELITISISGDTYQAKDIIKEMGFFYDPQMDWYITVSREWFKANSFSMIRKVCKDLKVGARDLRIIGAEAKMAVDTMDK